MKKFIYFLVASFIISAITFIGCQKDDIEAIELSVESDSTQNVIPRTGTADVVFYRTSLTTDNYLIFQFDNKRIYKLFNKAKVKEVRFTATTKPIIVVNGVQMKHYRIEVIFNDFTNHILTAYSKSSSNSFVFIPTGNNLLIGTHSAKFLQFETTGNLLNNNLYNFWLDTFENPNEWVIKKDGNNIISTRTIEPLDKSTNFFRLPNVN